MTFQDLRNIQTTSSIPLAADNAYVSQAQMKSNLDVTRTCRHGHGCQRL